MPRNDNFHQFYIYYGMETKSEGLVDGPGLGYVVGVVAIAIGLLVEVGPVGQLPDAQVCQLFSAVVCYWGLLAIA